MTTKISGGIGCAAHSKKKDFHGKICDAWSWAKCIRVDCVRQDACATYERAVEHYGLIHNRRVSK